MKDRERLKKERGKVLDAMASFMTEGLSDEWIEDNKEMLIKVARAIENRVQDAEKR